MKAINNFLIVFIGGGAGASLRYLLSIFVKNSSTGFPTSTFLINVSGCFLIGILYNFLSFENHFLKLLLLVGFLGGFTTFSSFGNETMQLFIAGKFQTAVFYILLSNICGIAAVYLGIKITLLAS